MFKRSSLLAGALLLVSPALASGHPGDGHPGDGPGGSFSGNCRFAVVVQLTPPLTNVSRPVRDLTRGHGQCWGTFTQDDGRSRQLRGTPVGYQAGDSGDAVSCLSSIQVGHGALLFPWGTLRFELIERRLTGVATLALTGGRGGSATEIFTPSTEEDPVELALACSGSGIARIRGEIDLFTTLQISG